MNGGKEEKSSQKSSQKIIELIKMDRTITTQAMADKIGISRRAVAKQIAILQEKNIIRRIGGDKGGYWEVMK
ncbi:MAG: HTH domain-containing protein [Treponema sp.]|nr:HTH domain-containing protein [Treponema sp.]